MAAKSESVKPFESDFGTGLSLFLLPGFWISVTGPDSMPSMIGKPCAEATLG